MKTRARPRQLPDGGWLQVTIRTRAAQPAGYCTGHADKPHATAAEADGCWRKYLLEQTLKLDATRGEQGKCIAPSGCETETNRTVVINGYPRGYWCDEHRNAAVTAQWWNAPRAAPGAS